jgi:hypothetical protein
MTYRVCQTSAADARQLDPQASAWQAAEVAAISHFLPESSGHRPRTEARLLHDGRALHGLFTVSDRYVRCVRTGYGSEVWKDSCVEFFIEPRPGRGYFNFEFNCGGAFLCNHITDPTRVADGFKQAVRLPAAIEDRVLCRSTLPRVVDPERPDPVTWSLQFHIPIALLEDYVGPLGSLAGQTWRGNFFKCAEDNSHPHWAAWSPVDEFNFHRPRCFGEIHFA